MAEFMQGDVDVPGIGGVKKAYILVPMGIAGAYVAYRWYQASRTAEEQPPAADGLYTSGDLSEYGLSTTGGPTTVTGNTGSVITDARGTDTIDDNAEWTNKATELLSDSGYDPATVRAALGEFLARRALDKAEASVARAALAAVGEPPVGRPWSVREEATTGTGTLPAPTNLRSNGTATSSTVPMRWDKVDGAAYYRIYRGTGENIGSSADTEFTATGLQPDTAYPFSVAAVSTLGKPGGRSSVVTLRTGRAKLGKPSGLKSSNVSRTSFRVSCSPVPGAQLYRWYVNGRASGATDASSRPYRDFTGMKPGTAYRITVAADVTTQSPGPESSPLTVKTRK